MSPFTAGMVLMLPLPALYARLRSSARFHDGPRPAALTVVAAGPAGGAGPAATASPPRTDPPVVRVVEGTRPPDTQPDVTPLLVAKAGSARRAEFRPPCHTCPCCRSYGQRLHDAHVEIDRLRGELVAADGRRINHTAPRPQPDVITVHFTGPTDIR